jgi:2-polyprenyl-3-methyl-5-hydroxy-6-metoxy-1,4-benzoquinol methylase
MADQRAIARYSRVHSLYRAAIPYIVPDVEFLLRRGTKRFDTVLDVGCGSDGSPFGFFHTPSGQSRTGIDAFQKSLDASRAAGIHDRYILGDIFALVDNDQFPRYDCVVALDVIEHFEKARGFEFLRVLERLAKRRVIIFTPNGFLPQDAYDGNEFQRHLSGWWPTEFRKLGYRVYGAHGLKPLRGDFAEPTIHPRKIGLLLSLASQYVTLALPQLAFHLFAVKDVG